MKSAELRQALAAFLGEERFLKFIVQLHQAGRLRYWQEGVWAEFTAKLPEFAVGFDDLQAALRICERHRCELRYGPAGVFRGSRDHTNRFVSDRYHLFPHAATEPELTEGASIGGNAVPVWYCPDCRADVIAWTQQLSATVTIEDLIIRKGGLSHEGIPIDELTQALEAVAASQAVDDNRIFGFRHFSDGNLLVTTGQILGGSKVLLRKHGKVWVVVEVGRWWS